MYKVINLHKLTVLIIIIFSLIGLSKTMPTKATIVGDEALAGYSKVLNDYYNAGGTSEELIRYLNLQKLISDDYEVLCRIVEAEATGGTIEQKVNVASCIINRCYSKEFPNTIEKVVFQKGQFSPISDKRYYSVKVTESTKEAIRLVLENDVTHNCLYFCAHYSSSYKNGWFSTLEESFFDGIHGYFTGRKKKK